MTLYEMSKQAIAAEPLMDGILFNQKIAMLADEMVKKEYWMLLCRERYDFTIFDIAENAKEKNIRKELMITLKNRGGVIFIDKAEDADNVWEIWVRDPETNENFAYYLFDYTNGVIRCT